MRDYRDEIRKSEKLKEILEFLNNFWLTDETNIANI